MDRPSPLQPLPLVPNLASKGMALTGPSQHPLSLIPLYSPIVGKGSIIGIACSQFLPKRKCPPGLCGPNPRGPHPSPALISTSKAPTLSHILCSQLGAWRGVKVQQ